ncbi:hypothetical protein GY45DRAFT_62516 [Cubamyces sp. BRFM 1775]|nr:hypothetical protein GY45DRAFT_62516 [Cubamyces sp. BRFM 1775]
MAVPSTQTPPTKPDHDPSNDVALAIQALVQNQLDQVLIETHKRRWETWHHEDLRQLSPADRQTRKQGLLQDHPGLLSGIGAVLLNQAMWQPMYILSITIPRADLKETTHWSNLRVCNVVWEHSTSGLLSLSLFNNHLEPTSSFRHVVTEGLSTKRNSQWAVGRRGVGFTHACRWLEKGLFWDKIGQAQLTDESLCGVALRVGQSVGKLVPRKRPVDDQSRPSFTHVDLSLSSILLGENSLESTPPSDWDASTGTTGPSEARRVDACLKLCLSESTMEGYERLLVRSDEVLVTVTGLHSFWVPERLFAGIWSIFPPAVSALWTIPSLAPNLPEITFYRPRAQRDPLSPFQGPLPAPRLYFQGYHVPSAPLHRLGINYWGYLNQQPSPDGSSVMTQGSAFDAYLSTLSAALDYAFRHIQDLAVEIAIDILTSSQSLPYTFGQVLPIPQNMDEDGIAAYRTAFEAAFRELDAPLSANEGRQYYPYLADHGEDEKRLILLLGLRPVAVPAPAKQLLERVRAYPPVRYRGEALLLSSPGVEEEPHGTDMLRASLSLLFPALGRDILSVRNYQHSWPRAAWNEETRSFVMGANCVCKEHFAGRDGTGPCVCWVGMALCEAVASWRSRASCDGGEAPQTVTYQEAIYALLRCTNGSSSDVSPSCPSGIPSGCTSNSAHIPVKGTATTTTTNQLDDGELEYLDPPPPSPAATPRPLDVPIPTSPSPQTAQFAVPPSPKGDRPPPSTPPLPRRRSRQQSSVFVITPLKPSAGGVRGDADASTGSSSGALMLTGLNGTTHTTASSPATALGQDVADMSDIWQDVQKRVNDRVQAMQTYYAREVSSLQDQLARAQAKISELEGTLASTREEHAAALSSIRAESEAVITAKEETLEARDRALEAKDDMLRARDLTIARLREGMAAQTRRATELQAEVRQWEARDKQKAAQLQQEMEGLLSIQRRVSSIMDGGRLRLDGGTGVSKGEGLNGRGAHGSPRRESLKNAEEGKGERVAKRMRLQ